MTAFDYDQYVRAEWGLFSNNPMRAGASLAALKGRKVTCVLDVGCGAGQEMIPFVVELGAFGVGLDIAPKANRAGRELFAAHYPAARVAFIRSAAEVLPILSKSCDVVICRIALPYMDNQQALAEMARGAPSRWGAAAQNPSYALLRAPVLARRSRLRRAFNDLRVARPRSRRLLSCDRTATTHSFDRKRGLSDPLVAPARAGPSGIINYR